MEPGSPPNRGESLPRRRIIRSRAIFDAARQRGHRLTDRCMTLQILPRDGPEAEVAFLTPKRIGCAVVRNRLRRRMREIYRRSLGPSAAKHSFVWLARAGAASLKKAELELCMCGLVKRFEAKR